MRLYHSFFGNEHLECNTPVVNTVQAPCIQQEWGKELTRKAPVLHTVQALYSQQQWEKFLLLMAERNKSKD